MSFSLFSPCTPAYPHIPAITEIHIISSNTSLAISPATSPQKEASMKLAIIWITVFFLPVSRITACIQLAIAQNKTIAITPQYCSISFPIGVFGYIKQS